MSKPNRRGADQWRQIIGAQRTSGLTLSAFCREQRISQPSFFGWRRRFDKLTAGGLTSDADPTFVELTTSSPEGLPGEAIEICLRGQRRLLVRRGFDRDLLSELINLLEGLA